MEIYLATSNKHKFEEVSKVFAEQGLELKQLTSESKIENKDETLEQTAEDNAKRIADKTGKVVVVDDTGVFFKAYNDFPGVNPAWVFKRLGYEGLLKLLEGKEREAYFKTVIAYCEPGKEPKVFAEKFFGEITKEVYDKDLDRLPYERIFKMKDGRIMSSISREEKNQISHRAKAFRRLLEWLKE